MAPGTGTEFRAFALTQIRCAQRVRCADGGWNVENQSARTTAHAASGLLMAGRIGTNAAAADGAGSALGEQI
ncbi:MAG TPA: hypothetical protein VNF27_05410 [Candidatus Binataceae bacterium]|nr:hypothetical protein [Candidatus Binataceae bacterium]